MMKHPIAVATLGVLAAVAYSEYRRFRDRHPSASAGDTPLQRWESEGGQTVARERPDTRFAAEGGPTGPEGISPPGALT